MCHIPNSSAWNSSAKGFYKDPSDGTAYWIDNGIWQNALTGLVTNPLNGKVLYVADGIWDNTFNGTVSGRRVVNGVAV